MSNCATMPSTTNQIEKCVNERMIDLVSAHSYKFQVNLGALMYFQPTINCSKPVSYPF